MLGIQRHSREYLLALDDDNLDDNLEKIQETEVVDIFAVFTVGLNEDDNLLKESLNKSEYNDEDFAKETTNKLMRNAHEKLLKKLTQ